MLPLLKHPVQVAARPVSVGATKLDPVFNVPVDTAGAPADATYGARVTFKAQVSFTSYKAHQVKPEGDKPVYAASMTILASDLPAGVDLMDALVESIAGTTVKLIIKELRPGGWTVGGKASLWRAQMREIHAP